MEEINEMKPLREMTANIKSIEIHMPIPNWEITD